MKKENFWMITIGIAIVAAVMMFCHFHKVTYRNHTDEKQSTEVVATEGDASEEVEKESNEEKFELSMKSFEEARYVTLERVVRTTVMDGDDYDSHYDSYVVSDIDLMDESDNTEEFADALAGSDYDEKKIRTISFKDGFGYDYSGLNGVGIHDTLLDLEGFETDYSDVVFDEKTHAMTGQRLYVFQKDCSALDRLLPEDFTGKVLMRKAYVQMVKDDFGKDIPDFYVALVRYEEAGKTIERSLYLQVTVND